MLRGLAALSVVLWHIREYLAMSAVGNNSHTVFSIITVIFSYSAPLFFVISGFLMSSLINSEYPNFLVRRLLRIYPTYILAVILVIFVKVAIFGSITQTQLFSSLSLLPSGQIPYVLWVEWTLVFEVFFYLICAIFATRILNLKQYFPYFLLVWAGIIGVNSYYYLSANPMLTTWNTIFTSAFNLLFISGALMFFFEKHIRNAPDRVNYSLASLSILIIAISEYLSVGGSFFARSENKIVVLGICFAILIYSTLNFKANPMSKFTSKLFDFGDRSYGLYLIHVPVITIFIAYLINQGISASNIIGVGALVSALLVGSYLGKLDVYIQKQIKILTKKSPQTHDESTKHL
ncbi:MAG: acyltransferase [Candidatus Methanoperedens sp.]|nr:acyltransferase [Candidatus Methanoperedens sp.]